MSVQIKNWGVKQLIAILLVVFSAGAFAVDTDHDGLPDDWESAHGRNPSVADYVIPNAPYPSLNCSISNGVAVCNSSISWLQWSLLAEASYNASFSCSLQNSKQIKCSESKRDTYYSYTTHSHYLGNQYVQDTIYITKGTIAQISGQPNAVCAMTEYGIELCSMNNFHHDPDGDGVEGLNDAFPLSASASVDTDADGMPDNCVNNICTDGLLEDADDDNDAVIDLSDNCPLNANADQLNTDGDAQGNVCDSDDDNDGLSDAQEAIRGTNPLLADTDADTVNDNIDNCPFIANSNQLDTNGDGIGDVCSAGSLDLTFNPGSGATYGEVNTSTVQTDGKILIGGLFTAVNGTARNYIARLNADGSLDTGFNLGNGVNYYVYTIAVQVDGKILIGGDFNGVSGTTRNRIARLNTDGSLDTSFNPGGGADNSVHAIAVQADGKILIGGFFTSVNGTARNYIARLNTDGSLDTGFNLGSGADNYVYTIAVQVDGKILIGGSFTGYNHTARNYIARLYADGSLDTSFNLGGGANGAVMAVALQADGKILIGGYFTSVNGTARNYIARLNTDGSLDGSFNLGAGPNNYVRSVVQQADGKIIIAGAFTLINGAAKKYIARLNVDGSLDNSFNTGIGPSYGVYTVAVQANGRLIIGGDFGSYDGVARLRIARILSGDSDNDGIEDAVDKFSLDPTESLDTDNDGIGNNADTDDDADGIPDASDNCPLNANADQADRDGDGLIDACEDADDDNDGVPDVSDRFPLNAAASSDVDADGFPDAWNVTCDTNCQINSGLTLDNCPSNTNPDQADTDGDGLPDACTDLDDDNDGIIDTYDLYPLDATKAGDYDKDGVESFVDNCVSTWNPDQLNTDGDTRGDSCDPDDDNDGVLDGSDKFPRNAAASVDTDDDGFPNNWNANCNAACQGSSGLHLDNCPSTANANQLDTDGDGLGDACDSDDDNDGVLDVNDNCPLNVNVNQLDSDKDTQGDVCDATPYNADAGFLDTTFNSGNGAVNVLATVVQADGKVIIAGSFTAVNGTARNYIARLKADGSVDTSFNPSGGPNSWVYTVALQADGKIVIGGTFSIVNGTARNNIARLNADGSLDTSFNPGAGTNQVVRTIVLQLDGKIIIGGEFTTVNGTAKKYIARLTANGSLDTSFNADTSINNSVYTVTRQSDGQLLVGGYFSNGLTRLNPDGSHDDNYWQGGSNGIVYSIAVQADGKIVFGGAFTYYNGIITNHLARLNSNGSVDTSFSMGGTSDILAVVVQADGKIIIGGKFLYPGNYIERLNADGSVDSSFKPNTAIEYPGQVAALVLQADGRVVVGGTFYGYTKNVSSHRIIRIHTGDTDSDGIEDAADKFPNDTDNDGLTNNIDLDDDNDGMPDDWEILYGLNSLVSDANGDLDGDGISNFQEYLNGTNPTVFNSAVSHNIKNDFSKDSASDVLWYDNASGNINIWNMLNGALANWNFIGYWPDTNNIPTLTGDINNDGNTDILWYNNTTGDVDAWMMQAGAKTDWTFLGYWPDANITPVLVGDFDGDGDDDILWYNSTTGDVDIWVMQAGARVDWLYVGYWPDPSFKPVLVGDFDGDGDDDILWWNNVSGDVDIWVMQNNTRSNWLYVGYWADTNNKPIGAGDFNNDGTDDIVWWNSTSGDVNLWTMQAGARSSWTYIGAWSDTNNHIEEIGDFNGDGTADILWRNITTGSVTIWPMLNGVKQTGQYIGTFGGSNSIKAGL